MFKANYKLANVPSGITKDRLATPNQVLLQFETCSAEQRKIKMRFKYTPLPAKMNYLLMQLLNILKNLMQYCMMKLEILLLHKNLIQDLIQ